MGLAFWQPTFTWLAPLSLLFLLIGIFWLWRLGSGKKPITELGFRLELLWRFYLILGFLIGFFLPLICFFVQVFAGWIKVSFNSTTNPIVFFSSVMKIAIIVFIEELVFRGYFLQYFHLNLGRGKAILSSSLLWSFLHLPNMLSSGLGVFLLLIGIVTFILKGYALGIGFLRTKNTLWFPFGLHFGYNLVFSLLASLTTESYHTPSWLVGHSDWAPESGLLGILLATAILVAVWFCTKGSKSNHYG